MNLNDSTEGRWFTPDPLGGDITNPQSLNRYAYAPSAPGTVVLHTGGEHSAYLLVPRTG